MIETNPRKLIKAKEAAARLTVSMYKMYELMNSRGFPTVIIGEKNGRKQYRIDEEKLDKWINKGGAVQINLGVKN